jgi:2-amino-4-hydroxy-6-hydroxymethyldihydropteridine diphosphokinase
MINTAVICLGSNIDPESNIRMALSILSGEQHLLSISQIVKTKPEGFSQQPDFLNCGALVETTTASFDEFNTYLKGIEQRLGRVRTSNRNGPRTIDLDVIVWNGKILGDDFYTRQFVYDAVVELLPGLASAQRPRDPPLNPSGHHI